MIDPFGLPGIVDTKAYYLTNEELELFEVYADKLHSTGPLYKNELIVRSLIYKFKNDLKTHFIEDIYNNSDAKTIVFIIEYNEFEKFFITFSIDDHDENAVDEILEAIKKSQSQIKEWFKATLNIFSKEESQLLTNPFMSYDLPGVPALIQQGQEVIEVSLSIVDVLSGYFHVDSSYKIKNNFQLKFSVGKVNYLFNAILKSQQPLPANNNSKVGFDIDYESYQQFKSWNKFILAMHLRWLKNKART